MALPGVRILVVEDDDRILWAYVLLLRLEGAQVTGAASGREALALSRTASFDVVLSDLGLPDIPGDVLIRAICATAPKHMRVIVVTGENEQSQTRAYEAAPISSSRSPSSGDACLRLWGPGPLRVQHDGTRRQRSWREGAPVGIRRASCEEPRARARC